MATSRKKQDERNLKTLRELAALQQNKYCFDCNQRGPTYVNVTIGSFVCTKCSGMLRGLTPPHRVKSISMATFTTEEIDLLRNRGNEYCQKVWLGLYEGTPSVIPNDELSIRDLMVEKYERRRFYLDPAKADVLSTRSVSSTNGSINSMSSVEHKSVKFNGAQMQSAHRTRPEVNRNHINNLLNSTSLNSNNSTNISTTSVFPVDFEKADIFNNMNGNSYSNGNSNGNLNNRSSSGTVPQQQQNGFANFDNNPVFSNTSSTTTSSSMPTAPTFTNMNGWNNHQNGGGAPLNGTSLNGSLNNNLNGSHNGSLNGTLKGSNTNGPLVPTEDKYAALKDLDNELKTQKNLEWNSTGSNGSLYSSSSPQSSLFGSPSQGHFMSAFANLENGSSSNISNPFNANTVNWGHNMSGLQQQQQQQQSQQQPFANPFRDTPKMNGFTPSFQPMFPMTTADGISSTNGWAPNPFKVGATTGSSNPNNPFL